jgi:DNA-binding CsgD family transcriptional regulator
LETFGFDISAERTYRAMVDHPDWGVTELADHLSLSERDVRTALDTLFACTLVRPSVEMPGRLRAVPLHIGLRHVLAQRQAEIVRQQAAFAESQATVQAMLLASHATAATTDPEIERLVGLDEIYDRLAVLAADTRTECLSVMPGGAQPPESLAASRPLDADALARGVDVRTLYQDSVRNDPATLDYARWLTELGGEVRTIPAAPPRMLILDRSIAIVATDPLQTAAGALQIRSAGVIASLLTLFEQAWTQAAPLGADRRPDADGLTTAQRELLRLQAQGFTDEAAAGRLGVSPRTARRMMAELMERLDARSRFEAGLKAAQRGWL